MQMSLFAEMNLLEIRSDAYPGERLMVCRNPLLARQRAFKRQEMLSKTEELLNEIVAATRRDRRPFRGQDRIALRVGKVVNKYKMAKHFGLDITEESFGYRRNTASIAAEATLNGLYVIRTSLPAEEMGAEATVRAYKGLSIVEQAFRSYKTVDLKVRPSITGAMTGCGLMSSCACSLTTSSGTCARRLAPLLFDDHDPAGAPRSSVVAPAKVSRASGRKPRPSRQLTASRCTASAACWRIWRPSFAIRWRRRSPEPVPSPS